MIKNQRLLKILSEFRDMKISKKNLLSYLEVEKANHSDVHFMVNAIHVIRLLEQYISHNINQKQLLEWVNTIWFSDWYDYDDTEEESIASIMHKLEELDESEDPLSYVNAKHYIQLLRENKTLKT